jgi:serine phosphatase RsbU (regulator of sigma subunit)
MTPHQKDAAEPRLLRTLGRDVREVGHALKRDGFTRPMSRTVRELEEFYLSTARQTRLAGMGPVKRWLFMSVWLVKSLFLRLTPARRVLLLLGFFLLATSIQISLGGGRELRINNFPGVGVALVLLVLMLELKDKLLAQNELEAGRAVQRALLPGRSAHVPGWDTWLFTQSANEVSGDLVDVLALDDARTSVALADVAGKGLPAALLMAKLQATLRALASGTRPLDDLGAQVNRILYRDGLPSSFSTLVYLVLSPGSPAIELVNAGHMPPLVLRRDGRLDELPRGGPALGLLAESTYQVHGVALDDWETMVVFSDGVTEAMNRAGEFFGDERLRAIVAGGGLLSAQRLGERILADVEAFVDDAPVHDDISLLIVRRLGAVPPPV